MSECSTLLGDMILGNYEKALLEQSNTILRNSLMKEYGVTLKPTEADLDQIYCRYPQPEQEKKPMSIEKVKVQRESLIETLTKKKAAYAISFQESLADWKKVTKENFATTIAGYQTDLENRLKSNQETYDTDMQNAKEIYEKTVERVTKRRDKDIERFNIGYSSIIEQEQAREVEFDKDPDAYDNFHKPNNNESKFDRAIEDLTVVKDDELEMTLEALDDLIQSPYPRFY